MRRERVVLKTIIEDRKLMKTQLWAVYVFSSQTVMGLGVS